MPVLSLKVCKLFLYILLQKNTYSIIKLECNELHNIVLRSLLSPQTKTIQRGPLSALKAPFSTLQGTLSNIARPSFYSAGPILNIARPLSNLQGSISNLPTFNIAITFSYFSGGPLYFAGPLFNIVRPSFYIALSHFIIARPLSTLRYRLSNWCCLFQIKRPPLYFAMPLFNLTKPSFYFEGPDFNIALPFSTLWGPLITL